MLFLYIFRIVVYTRSSIETSPLFPSFLFDIKSVSHSLNIRPYASLYDWYPIHFNLWTIFNPLKFSFHVILFSSPKSVLNLLRFLSRFKEFPFIIFEYIIGLLFVLFHLFPLFLFLFAFIYLFVVLALVPVFLSLPICLTNIFWFISPSRIVTFFSCLIPLFPLFFFT